MPISNVAADLRYSIRQLRRSPGFAAITLLTLTLAIAANVVVFAVMNALVLTPLPVANPRRVVQVEQVRDGGGLNVSYPNYRDLRDQNKSFSALSAIRAVRFGMGGNGSTAPVWGYEVSGNYFPMLGIKPQLGRFISQEDDARINGSPVAVLSYASWQVRFNSDPDIVGKTVMVSKHPYTVIGVAPKNFSGSERFLWPEVWLPYSDSPEVEGLNWIEARGNSGTWMVGRLKDGVTIAQATADLNRVSAQLAQQYPNDNSGLKLKISRPGLLGDMLGGPVRSFLAGVMGLALLVLIAACANLGSLFSSRLTDRARELGIRLAVGSTRVRLLQQLLTESVLLSLAGGVAASAASAVLLNAMARWQPAFGDLPVQFLVQPTGTVFFFATLLALSTGVLFGIIPARQIWQADPNQTLKAAGSTASTHGSKLQPSLITIQIALCCLLVTTSFVAVRGLQRTFSVPLGFEPAGVTLATTDMHMAGYEPAKQSAMQQRLLAAVSQIPGVTSAAYAVTTPLSSNIESNTIYAPGTTDFAVAKGSFDALDFSVSPGYLATTGTRLIAGRDFTIHDDARSPQVAIVNETFARRLFNLANAVEAVGKVYPTGPKDSIEVVGVVADGKYESLTEDAKPALFWPILQRPRSQTVLLIKSDSSSRLGESIPAATRRALEQIDAGIPILTITSWTDALDLVTFPARAATIALGVLGGLGVMLALTGIFGLASYTVSRRRRELGIRAAMGAQAWQLLRAALGRTLALLAVGSGIGLVLGFASTRLLAGIVYQASASDPWVIVSVACTMVALGAIASAFPARRALKIDPVVLLREE